jgi:D-arabinitol dehydrogenase (NADP+)
VAKSMLAAVIDRPHQIAVREVPIPELQPDEALVRVEAAGVCGTDVHIFDGGFLASYPIIAGHEFAGTIVALGPEVTGYQVGDRVACEPSISCDHCYFCRRNLHNHCENWQSLGVTRPGAFAEYVAVPRQCLYRIERLSFAEAAFVEPLACVVFGQERARLQLGDNVLIFGAGAIGLQHLQLIRRAGAAQVAVVDKRSDRLELASTLGADWAIVADGTESQKLRDIAPRGFKLVIDATGVSAVVEQAVQYVMNSGKLLVFGVCPQAERISVSPFEIYRRDLQIVGSFAIRRTFSQAVSLLEAGAIEVKPLIGQTITLSELPEALALMARGQAPMKIQVCNQG